jgi:hypothetical protein
VLPHVLDAEIGLLLALSEFDGSVALGNTLRTYLKVGILVREFLE